MSDTITVDETGGTDVVFTEVSSGVVGRREFRVASDTPATVRKITHECVFRSNPAKGMDRRRFYVSKNVADSVTGVVHTASITCEFALPPTDSMTSAMVANMVAVLVALLAKNSSGTVDYANVAAIMQGYLPTGDLAV